MKSTLKLTLLCSLFVYAFSRQIPSQANDDWSAPNLYSSMSIGTPGKEFKLLIDLHLEDALLAGPKCSSYNCQNHYKNRTIYDPSKSSTSKDVGEAAKVEYGSGTVKGEYYTDTVVVDGINATDVGFSVLVTGDSKFSTVIYDGVLGLSFLGHTRGKKQLPSPVDSILKFSTEKTLQMWLNQATSNDDRYGTVTFGKANTDKCNTDTKYASVGNDDFSFIVQKIRYATFVAHRELDAVIDPTYRYIGLPTTIYKGLMRVATGGTGTTSVYCSNLKQITLDVKIGGSYYSLKAEDFSIQQSSSSDYCSLLVDDLGEEFETQFRLGEPFLRRYCVTYDLENSELGFSSVKGN
ncbi:hypothetical protein M3Y94_00260300 [Aphelenchoides besseyi]|nr:hypothetical protein M3Y94_00260300 [Aphelenchoides besseyi]KAI6236178.1 Asp-domain-containing protein [Aphelenchoides besseyi]